MSKPTSIQTGEPDSGGTLDQELHAASAKIRSKMVQLWLIDPGCTHDLVSLSDITRSGDKLRPLFANINLQTQWRYRQHSHCSYADCGTV
eukprot:238178-Heterocapsa_arctica.AAC.1